MEVYGEVTNRTQVKRREAYVCGVSRPPAAKPGIRRAACVRATGCHEALRSYPGRSLGLRGEQIVSGSIEGRKN
jgi:hypothetical protein